MAELILVLCVGTEYFEIKKLSTIRGAFPCLNISLLVAYPWTMK